MFGGVIEAFPETEPYLVYNAQVVKYPAYEWALCKLQGGEELTHGDDNLLESF